MVPFNYCLANADLLAEHANVSAPLSQFKGGRRYGAGFSASESPVRLLYQAFVTH